MLQTLAALDSHQDRVVFSDTRHLAARGASGSISVGGDEFYLGVKLTRFRTFPCLTLVLDLFLLL